MKKTEVTINIWYDHSDGTIEEWKYENGKMVLHKNKNSDGTTEEWKYENGNITLRGIKSWVYQCNSIHSLQSLRAKINKRIKIIMFPKEESPFAHIPVEQKREILRDLFVDDVKGEK